jgi:hypothetical protein
MDDTNPNHNSTRDVNIGANLFGFLSPQKRKIINRLRVANNIDLILLVKNYTMISNLLEKYDKY